MKFEDVPLIGHVLESGAEDRVLDGLLLAGPLVVVLLAVLGRNLLTEAVAATYLLVFVFYVLYSGLRKA